jgi:two-component system OmpR family response regulator
VVVNDDATSPAPNARRVLVVDDEPHLADLVAMATRLDGYIPEIAGTGYAALEAVERFDPDLIILDVQLPDLDGFEVQRRLRADGCRAPVIFLTARDAIEDKIQGLTIGGDDYVTKPFSIDELLARMRAVLRRIGHDDNALLTVGDLTIDEDTRQVRRGEDVIDLTPTEYRLLRYLMINAKKVVSKRQILDHVWYYDCGGDSGLVETYISYVRRKVDTPDRAPMITTVRGFGYMLRPAKK